MDYNAPPNCYTFGKVQQEFGLSSGLSNRSKLSIAADFLDLSTASMRLMSLEAEIDILDSLTPQL